MLKRRALSPKPNNTFIALSSVDCLNNRYQELWSDLKLKYIRVYTKPADCNDRKLKMLDHFNGNKVEDEKLVKKNEVLLSMMK